MGPDEVRVALLDLDAARAESGDDEASDGASDDGAETLDSGERARAAALRDPVDRRRYVAAHVELRRLLGEATGVAAEGVVILRSACASCGKPHGKPVLADGTPFSLSRSGRWALVAVGGRDPLGVDLEQAQDHAALDPLRETLLARDETSDDLLRTWVRKEALLKASGEGLTRSMTEVRADDSRISDLDLPPGLFGALAALTPVSHVSTKVWRR